MHDAIAARRVEVFNAHVVRGESISSQARKFNVSISTVRNDIMLEVFKMRRLKGMKDWTGIHTLRDAIDSLQNENKSG